MLWRVHNLRLKTKHYYSFEANDERWENRPGTMPEEQFKDLINYWDIEEIEEQSKKDRLNRLIHDDPHTMGPYSFALLHHELIKRLCLKLKFIKSLEGENLESNI